jgi:HlyD family secretion protein
MSSTLRNILIAVVVIALVGAGIFFVVQRQQAAASPEFEILREAEVTQDRIASTVNATGAIEPESLVTLTFGLGGTVQEVNVIRGQTVAVDDILAQVDTSELALSVQQAADALRIQQLTEEQRVNAEPSPATLASAEADIQAAEANVQVSEANLAASRASLQQAQAQKAQILAGASPGQIAAAESQVAQAREQQRLAQETYNRTIECVTFTPPGSNQEQEVCPGLGAPEEQARAALESATLGLRAAEQQLTDLNNPAQPADVQAADAAIAAAAAQVQAAEGNVAAAEANLARARAAYDRLLEKPAESEIAILQAQIASAQTNLDLANLRLRQAQLIAPIAGRVASVLIKEGEQATPGAPAITLVNEDAFHITVSVDEIDIDRVEVGQPVDITLDALPDRPVVGTVSEIAPTSSSTSGVVTYLVTINIDEDQTEGLRPGLSASASITVDELDGVLVVPNWAVRLNRDTGEAFVLVKQPDGTAREVVVETGLRNEQFSEVLSGLSAGDVVVLTNEREGITGLFGG